MINKTIDKLEKELFKLGFYDQEQGKLNKENFSYKMTEVSKKNEAVFYFNFRNMTYRVYIPKK